MERNKNIKIIVIAQKYLNMRTINTLQLDILSQYFDIEHWDVSHITGYMSDADSQDRVTRDYSLEIHSYMDLKQRLKRLPPDSIAIGYTYMQYSTCRLHKTIAQYVSCCVRVVDNPSFWNECASGHTSLELEGHEVDFQSSNEQRRKNESRLSQFKHLLYKSELIYRIAKYIRYRGDYRYKQLIDSRYYSKCENSYTYLFYVGMSKSADYPTCSQHFDTIVKLKNENLKIVNSPYIVFLDSYYPMHPDWRNRVPNFDWAALQEPYFKSLNTFFDKIEKEYDCQVVIGAHPNAIYEKNPYGNRLCVKYKSVELVKDARAVMMHATGSTTFVAYYNKPFCFLTNNAFKAGDFPNCMYRTTVKMADVLGMPLIDTDSVNDVKGIFAQLEPNLRSRFLDMYFGDTENIKTYAEQLSEAFIDIYNRIKH